jgi:hypothetical protein
MDDTVVMISDAISPLTGPHGQSGTIEALMSRRPQQVSMSIFAAAHACDTDGMEGEEMPDCSEVGRNDKKLDQKLVRHVRPSEPNNRCCTHSLTWASLCHDLRPSVELSSRRFFFGVPYGTLCLCGLIESLTCVCVCVCGTGAVKRFEVCVQIALLLIGSQYVACLGLFMIAQPFTSS